MSELKIYAVTGKPILHSLSPVIFNAWFRSAKMNAVYTRLAAEDAEDAVTTARAMKLAGLNVTSPFKEEIMRFLDGADAHASKIGAVNCVIRRGTWLRGCNTDFIGVVRSLRKNGIDPANRRVAILGGGAARAAAYGVLRARAAGVTFLNRTAAGAENASIRMGCDFVPLDQADRVIARSDIFISCVPSPPGWNPGRFLKSGAVALQADYRNDSPQAKRGPGKPALVDGREWLLYQAVPAFRLFTGRRPSPRQIQKTEERIASAAPQSKTNIALVGFMGSGKTAIGRILSKMMGWDFVDTDAEVERLAGMTVPEIFARRGEPFFRQRERSLIRTLVPSASRKVFSLGGGAVLNEESRSLLSRHCHVVWLWVSLETALARIDLASRPVLRAARGERAVRRAFRSRSEACARIADLVLSSETASPEASAGRIRHEMDPSFED
jgi:shikimate dehydrogenase